MANIQDILQSVVKKAKQAESVGNALNAIKPIINSPMEMFDVNNPLSKLSCEPIHAHKAFMDFIAFGGSNFTYWLVFRFPTQKFTRRKYNIDKAIPAYLPEKLGDASDWLHLTSLRTCENWYKSYLWKDRSERNYKLMSEKIIKQTEEIQLEAKKEQLQKVVSSISELAMAIVNKSLRAKLKQIEENPNSETIRDIKALAELGINSHPLLKEAKAEDKEKAKQINVQQNNYHFNSDIAKQIHGDIKDLS
jgi:hypothetical protein